MKTRRILLLALIGLCLAGCKSGKRNQELLERELRCQEDHIYELEDALDQCEAELESTRRESQTLKRGGAGDDLGRGRPSDVPVIDLPSDSGSAPRRRGEHAEPTLPTVEPGEEFTPTPSATDSSDHIEPSDRNIARIVLNKQLTGGLNHRRQGGDQGILVVFEPRNARGEMVAEPGDVSIALVDPERAGPQARIARWDFAANEAFEQFHRTGKIGRGYELELPWPDAAPRNKKLQLYVRYVTPDGRKLMSEMTLNIDPPAAGQARHWHTPAGRAAQPAWSDANVQTARARRRSPDPEADRGSRNSDAPRFISADAQPADDETDEADQSAEDEERPAAVARRPADDRPSNRPTWTPYR